MSMSLRAWLLRCTTPHRTAPGVDIGRSHDFLGYVFLSIVKERWASPGESLRNLAGRYPALGRRRAASAKGDPAVVDSKMRN